MQNWYFNNLLNKKSRIQEFIRNLLKIENYIDLNLKVHV